MNSSTWSVETSAVSVELKRFIAEKCAQVRAETRAPEHPMSPESKSLLASAEAGDWRGAFDALAALHQAFRKPESDASRLWAVYPVEWAVVNEIGAALEEFAEGDEEYAIAFARDIISSIPPESIYLAGSDPGRFLVTALSKSHVNGDPFFTVTQNAMVDSRSYLRYLRGMYGDRIYVPTDEDVARSINAYKEGARCRQREGKLLPGEMIEEVEGEIEIRGQVGLMAVNGLLTRLMFDRNPEHEFYVEESFPLDWMYSHLIPHKLVLKINRQPLPQISSDLAREDREDRTTYVEPLLGNWLREQTPVSEIAAFMDRVHVQKNLDGFAGDPAFVRNERVQRIFSKLRSSIGGVYTWRAEHAGTPAEKQSMLTEADFALRQAFALCPASPEAAYKYISLLVNEKRLTDAVLLAETAVAVEEAAASASPAESAIHEDYTHTKGIESQAHPGKLLTPLGSLLEQLKRMQSNQGQ